MSLVRIVFFFTFRKNNKKHYQAHKNNPPLKIEKSQNIAGSYFSEISDSAGFYFSEKLPRIWAGFYFLVKNFNFALFLHCKMPKIFPARFARRGFIFLRNFLGGVLFF